MISGVEVGINLKVEGGIYGPKVILSVEILGNGAGVELGVEVEAFEAVSVKENLEKRGSELVLDDGYHVPGGYTGRVFMGTGTGTDLVTRR